MERKVSEVLLNCKFELCQMRSFLLRPGKRKRWRRQFIMWEGAQWEWAPLTMSCWNESTSCKYSKNAAFPHFAHAPSRCVVKSLGDRRTPTCCIKMTTIQALKEIHYDALSPVIVFGATEAQICKLTNQLLRACTHTHTFPPDGKVITFIRDDRLHER